MSEYTLAKHNKFKELLLDSTETQISNQKTPEELKEEIVYLNKSIEKILKFGPVNVSNMEDVKEKFSKINSNEEIIGREQFLINLIKERGITRF